MTTKVNRQYLTGASVNKVNNKLILILISVLVFIVVATAAFIFLKPKAEIAPPAPAQPQIISETDSPQIVSIKPANLEESIFSSNESIEITFNRSLENVGEFKVRIDPTVEFKKTVSSDRKTGIITFEKPLEPGKSFTIFIGSDTKFDGVGAWGQSRELHFRTVTYKGI